MTNPDSRAPAAHGSGAPRRSLRESLARGAVGAAWTIAGPLRWGAGVAVRTTEAAVSEVAARAFPRPAEPVTVPPAPAEPALARLIDRAIGPLRPVIDAVVRLALDGLDLTQVVLDKVDLDTVVAAVDLDAAVERVDLDRIVDRVDVDRIIGRLDLDAIVARVALDRIVDRLDLDAIVARVDIEGVVAGLDLDAIVERVALDRIISRLDLDHIVEGVDLNRIVDRLDLDAIVGRVDIEGVVAGLDLDAIVARVDIDRIIDRVDFDAAIAKIDIIRIAEDVVDGIDLAGIIRDSTGSLASEAVHGVRVQGQQADDAIGQFVGRMLGRRRQLDGSPIGPAPDEPPPAGRPPSQNGQFTPPHSPPRTPSPDRNRPR